MLMKFAAHGARLARADNGANAFGQHQRTDDSQEHHIGQLDDEIDLANGLQEGEQRDTKRRADHTARHQDAAHFEIDIAAPHVREHARNR